MILFCWYFQTRKHKSLTFHWQTIKLQWEKSTSFMKFHVLLPGFRRHYLNAHWRTKKRCTNIWSRPNFLSYNESALKEILMKNGLSIFFLPFIAEFILSLIEFQNPSKNLYYVERGEVGKKLNFQMSSILSTATHDAPLKCVRKTGDSVIERFLIKTQNPHYEMNPDTHVSFRVSEPMTQRRYFLSI